MAIHRAPRPEDHFTQIRNDVLRDDRLSYRARGVLAVILSRPDDWTTSSEELARTGTEGRDAIRTALSELEDAGYLVREKRQDDRGRWSTHQVIYDTPRTEDQPGLFAPPTTENQASENQPSVFQASKEHGNEQSSPNGEERTTGKVPPIPNQIASAVYDHAQGMVNFMAIRQVAARALKVKGTTQESITTAMVQLYDGGRPVTFQTVGQTLSRTKATETNQDHWASGAQF